MKTNLLLDKVLDTPESIAAMQQLSAEGINLNFTRLFGLPEYWKVADADQVLKDISSVGIDLDVATDQLENEEAVQFSEAFEQLMTALHEEWAAIFQAPANP